MKNIFLLILLFVLNETYAQSKFQFLKNTDKQKVKFELINNLIVFPLEINGKELSFILDTGVNKSLLFNFSDKDSLQLNNKKKVSIRGLGAGKPMEGVLSKNNFFRIKNIIGSSQEIFVILDDTFKLSSKMGKVIHGIIGYDLLKDVVVEINYARKLLIFYKPESFEGISCKKCESFGLDFFRNKPYINATIKQQENSARKIPVKLLIDSGGSDALWLFEGTKKNIETPSNFFDDILGEGFSGTIYGKRSRIEEFSIGGFTIEKPTVSFLDSLSTFNARKFKERNGSIGSGILKRFRIWINYPERKVTFKKATSLKKGFYYNMSGIYLVHNGLVLTKESDIVKNMKVSDNYIYTDNIVSKVIKYTFKFRPSYRIDRILKDSPAERVGLEAGDQLLELNGKPAYEYTLEQIISIFQTKPNKKITVKVKRGITELRYKFRLEQRI